MQIGIFTPLGCFSNLQESFVNPLLHPQKNFRQSHPRFPGCTSFMLREGRPHKGTVTTDNMNQEQNENEVENVENLHAKVAPKRRAPIVIGGRDAMIKAITENAERIAEIGGSPLLTARQVLDALKSEKLLSPLALAEIKSANGVGDTLGIKHMDLPVVRRSIKREYLIQAAGWTREEKQAFDQKSAEEQQAVILKMTGDFLVHRES